MREAKEGTGSIDDVKVDSFIKFSEHIYLGEGEGGPSILCCGLPSNAEIDKTTR